jgi:uncharacterized delta-60 repeat protein
MKKSFISLIIPGFLFSSLGSFAQPGNLDANFNMNCGSGTNGAIYSLDIQPDGKIILGGNFTNFNAFADGNLDRILPTGGIDGTFIVGTGFDGFVNKIEVLSSGKILTAGGFLNIQGNSNTFLGLLNDDGTVNSIFAGVGTNSYVKDFIELPSGKIMIGGHFLVYNGSSMPFLGIIYDGGNQDGATNIGAGPDGFVNGIVGTSDRAFLFGNFTAYDGHAANGIVKIYHDGTFDSSFDCGLGANSEISSLVVQTDGKIIVGGSFTSFNGVNCNGIVRLNTNGTVDASFNIGTGFSDYVKDMIIQPDGKIIVIGNFNQYNGVNRAKILRLLPNGTLDPVFNPGTGFNLLPHDLQLTTDGNVVVVGEFTEYNSTPVGHLVKLNGAAALIEEFKNEELNHLYPNPSSSDFSIRTDDLIEDVSIFNSMGILVYQGKSKHIELKNPESGIYLVRVKTNRHLWTEKLEIY